MPTSDTAGPSDVTGHRATKAPKSSGRARREASELDAVASRPSLWDAALAGEPVLAERALVSTIRDSLYDLIPLSALEVELIATPEFVRLQGVKQLGFVYRVWPGATHTRFEHSLGVYYLMLRALHALRSQAPDLLSGDDTTPQTLLAAALLHDVGHYPFSHAIEELGYPVLPHEKVGRLLIEAPAISAVLSRHGLQPGRVADLVDPPRDRPLLAEDSLLIRLLSGALDVDKLDYLPRDARACNVPYGGVDVTRLLGSLRVLETTDGARLGVSDKGISPLNSLLHARQEMFDNVYWHHTNRAMMAMLLRAVQEALEAHAIMPTDLYGHDDSSLLALLGGEGMPEGARALVSGLRMRQPYKVLLEVSARAGKLFSQLDALFWDQAKRRRVEIELAAALAEGLGASVAPYETLVDVPKPEKWEMDVQVRFAQPPIGMVSLMTWAEATGQRPSDLGVYEQHQRRIRVVASERVRALAGGSAEALLLPVLERIPML
ncbi:MAG: dNTP triphosphohydrolase, broad substrate specificity [Ktedonobacterales bacterium]|jgi:HD superfamily phosphohydrolase|nr:MAG: dNTP triphosphohydrolase, broad substrate specificity [Ktedonobacterales bacterium]